MTLTPGQVHLALKAYPMLDTLLREWFPCGCGTATIKRCGGAGQMVETLVLLRADVQSVLDGLTCAISELGEQDRRIVTVRYLQRRDLWGTAEAVGLAYGTLRHRLDAIHAELAVRLRMDMRYWRAYSRFARAVLERENEDEGRVEA